MKPKILYCAIASFAELLLVTTNKNYHFLGIMAWQRQRICCHLAQRIGLFTDVSSTTVVDMKLLLHPLEQLQTLQTRSSFCHLVHERSCMYQTVLIQCKHLYPGCL